MNFLKKQFLIFMILLLGSVASFSQESVEASYPVDSELEFATGPAIGDKVPDFELRDQSGKRRSLRDLVGKNGAVIDFHRSADW